MENSKVKNRLLIIVILFSLPSILYAQAPSIEWQKSYGCEASGVFSILQNSDSGFVFVGASEYISAGYHGGMDVWFVKLNNTGNIMLQKCLGGSDVDAAKSIIQTSDGGYAIAGITLSNDGDVSGNHSLGPDAWIVKLDPLGKIQWQKCIGGLGDDGANCIIQTFDKGYIVAGYTTSSDGDVSGFHGIRDAWIVKLSTSGSIEWSRCFGGTGSDEATSIIQLPDSSYVFAGWTTLQQNGDVIGNHGAADGWLVKLDFLGNIIWQKCLGGSNDDYANSLIKTFSGDLCVTGYSNSKDGDMIGNHGLEDAWVIKIDTSGIIKWKKSYGGTQFDRSSSIIETQDNGFVFTGYTESFDGDVKGGHGGADIWVVKINELGDIQWQKCIGGTAVDFGNSIIQLHDNSFILDGFTYSSNGDAAGNDTIGAWIVKLSAPSLVQEQPTLSQHFSLSTYPNPAANIITLAYDLPKSSAVGITIYSVTGERMKEIHEASVESGHHEAALDLSGFPDGTYFISVSACGVTERKMVQLIK